MSDTLSARRKQRQQRTEVVQLPPPQRTRADVVAATFANIDLRAAKAALETYYQKFTHVEAENKMLREELEQHEEDSLKVVRHLEEELDKSNKETSHYKNEVNRIVAQNKDSSTAMMEKYNEILKDRDRQIAEYASLTERLQGDLRQASRYVQQRQEHVMELKHLHDQLEEMAAKHEKDLTALRFQTLDRKIKLVALEKTMRQGFKDMVEEESNRLLDVQHRTLLERNRVLEEEKVDMAHDIEDLMHLANNFTKERETMKRRAELHRRAHEEVLRHTVASSRHSREKEMKVQRLEAKVRELLLAHKTIEEDMERRYSAKITSLEHELRETNSALQLHRLELRQMRELASRVVQQRTDLERFFYVALQDCQRYRHQLNASASAGKMSISPRPLSSTSGSGSGRSEVGSRHYHLSSSGSGTREAIGTAFNSSSFSIQPPPHADTITRENMMDTTTSSRSVLNASKGRDSTNGTDVKQAPLPPVNRQQGIDSGVNPSKKPPLASIRSKAEASHTNTNIASNDTFMTQTSEIPAEKSPPRQCPGAAAPPPDPGVYIDNLPWEDKEKIIKALLFYINSTYYKSDSICKV